MATIVCSTAAAIVAGACLFGLKTESAHFCGAVLMYAAGVLVGYTLGR